MSASSSSDNNNGDYTRINWTKPGDRDDDNVSTKNATLALKTAIAVARAFDANCALRNPAKECTIPMFEPQELILGEPLRSSGFFTDLGLRGIKLTRNLQHGEFSEEEEDFRERFAERSIDGHYAVKFLQKGLYNSVHAASAASDMMMETKILMNLAPHPNICQIYGVTAAGSDAFLSRGKDGFYIILDRLSGTMFQRLQTWREQQEEEITTRKAKGDDDAAIAVEQYQQLMQRLEVALDVGSALLFLNDRQIVFHLRPEKIGFDVRYGRIKLCDFGQARENGQLDQAPSLTKTDDIRTLAYTAPEVLCQAPVTVATDVYAYGVVLWEILSLQRPFDRLSRSDHFEKAVMHGERPHMPPTIPEAVQTLIEKCWDPYLRPTMKKVYDTVEEVLLFQDDKPEISVLPVLHHRPPLQSAASATAILVKTFTQDVSAESSAKLPRTLRRSKTEENPYAGGKSRQEKPAEEPRRRRRHHQSGSSQDGEEGPMKDRSKGSNHGESSGRVSRKNRHKSSNHEKSGTSSSHDVMKDKSRSSSHDVMKDKSRGSSHDVMKDKSKSSSHDVMKDKSKSSSHDVMKDRSRSSNHDVMKDKSRSSNHDVMKDKSRSSNHGSGPTRMKDESKDSHGAPMKDRSKKERTSRRSRATSSNKKIPSEEASQSTKTTAAETHSTVGENNQSLPELLQENEGKEEYVGESMKVMASPSAEKKRVKPTQTLPTIPAVEGESQTMTGQRRSRR